MPRGRRWTAREEKRLRKLSSEGLSDAEISRRMRGRTQTAVRSRRAKLGIDKERGWTDAEDAVLREEYAVHKAGSTLTAARCAERLPGRSREACRVRAHRLGLLATSAEGREEA